MTMPLLPPTHKLTQCALLTHRLTDLGSVLPPKQSSLTQLPTASTNSLRATRPERVTKPRASTTVCHLQGAQIPSFFQRPDKLQQATSTEKATTASGKQVEMSLIFTIYQSERYKIFFDNTVIPCDTVRGCCGDPPGNAALFNVEDYPPSLHL